MFNSKLYFNTDSISEYFDLLKNDYRAHDTEGIFCRTVDSLAYLWIYRDSLSRLTKNNDDTSLETIIQFGLDTYGDKIKKNRKQRFIDSCKLFHGSSEETLANLSIRLMEEIDSWR